MHPLYKYILAIATLTVVPGMTTIARAQDIAGLPACAKPALLAAFQTSGCKATDAECLCSNPHLLTTLQSYVEDACSQADQDTVIAFGQTYCGKQGTQMTPPPDATQASFTTTVGPTTTPTGGAAETGMSAAALAITMGGMGWLLAEL